MVEVQVFQIYEYGIASGRLVTGPDGRNLVEFARHGFAPGVFPSGAWVYEDRARLLAHDEAQRRVLDERMVMWARGTPCRDAHCWCRAVVPK